MDRALCALRALSVSAAYSWSGERALSVILSLRFQVIDSCQTAERKSTDPATDSQVSCVKCRNYYSSVTPGPPLSALYS